ncbi:hypothetical protein [Micromonospora sp. IBHARD004]|uniref:hypothetical protein n=1 Tax=Micromonospora sp. IBHARD004 TaxID=3457764 RepID=UPI004057F1FD
MSDSPIDGYLDRLFDRLAGTGAAGRRTMVEAEDHLPSAVAQAVAEGADPAGAERLAVARSPWARQRTRQGRGRPVA